MSQMERDLSNRIGERLLQWTLDSQELFQMGELKRGRAREAVIFHLMVAITICIARWAKPEADAELYKSFKEMLQENRKKVKSWGNDDSETSI